ncbi:hypothetical protein BD293_4001 [Roseinatronobacter monicus]|uniref:Uncharacterized protein n=1 Tax=Roseinatronobacter monicus TaxID=393481 RepID=A0A543K4T1_9RHOB|nr:hypothetical protein BD293_4001 [Roseinatronobacter monicus]
MINLKRVAFDAPHPHFNMGGASRLSIICQSCQGVIARYMTFNRNANLNPGSGKDDTNFAAWTGGQPRLIK